ncbi:hypothetical protein [Sorangium sp. So ce887]|uniref:hypothetical protein n=1 Tax=Sorangium sp. So ce887 TaxID=3133324 RepID=UPI003F6207CD
MVTCDSTTGDGETCGVVDVLNEHVKAGATNDALTFAGACFAQESAGTPVTVIRSAAPAVRGGARAGTVARSRSHRAARGAIAIGHPG